MVDASNSRWKIGEGLDMCDSSFPSLASNDFAMSWDSKSVQEILLHEGCTITISETIGERDPVTINKEAIEEEEEEDDWRFDDPADDLTNDMQQNVDQATRRLAHMKEQRQASYEWEVTSNVISNHHRGNFIIHKLEDVLLKVIWYFTSPLKEKQRSQNNKEDECKVMVIGFWETQFTIWDPSTNQLQGMSGKIHHTRVNGQRLKPYFSQILEEQVDSAQVSLNNDKPLGLIAQDPFLAQHVPCISSMSIGPITRPCIDTDSCNPGTTMEHLSNGREDECTSRLQGKIIIEEAFEQEA